MRRIAVLAALTTITTFAVTVSPISADAQSLGDRLKKKAEEAAKKKAEERTEKRAGEAADKALDKLECAASDRACQERAAQGGSVSLAAGGSAGKVGEGVWVNYDFKPGDRPLFVDDFTRDEVGNFPRRLEMKQGNMEVVVWNGTRFLRGTTNTSTFEIPLKETLPERFTLEFDLKFGLLNYNRYHVYFFPPAVGGNDNHDQQHHRVIVRPSGNEVGAGVEKGSSTNNLTKLETVTLQGQLIPVRVMVDGRYVKMYLGNTRVANMPNANLGRSKSIRIELPCSPDEPCFVGNIRVMAGGKKLYDALSESGRVATQGIYFDTGSDRIRPESTPTLKEIGEMLSEHPDLKLTIEGHTDNVGDSKANAELSQRRAAAVRAYLIEKHAIDASRLTSAGVGDKKPVGANTTPEGRQQNRRVELVKM